VELELDEQAIASVLGGPDVRNGVGHYARLLLDLSLIEVPRDTERLALSGEIVPWHTAGWSVEFATPLGRPHPADETHGIKNYIFYVYFGTRYQKPNPFLLRALGTLRALS
jgi:hypothetical protein